MCLFVCVFNNDDNDNVLFFLGILWIYFFKFLYNSAVVCIEMWEYYIKISFLPN